jgi:hypothetical protein
MFRLCKAILPQMKEGGFIINTASIQSFDPSENLIAYASTKAAVVSFTRSLAAFAIKRGVRVNAVAPGAVWTPLIPSTMPKEKVTQFGSQTVFGRAAQRAEMPRSSYSSQVIKPATSLEKFTASPEVRCLSDMPPLRQTNGFRSGLRCSIRGIIAERGISSRDRSLDSSSAYSIGASKMKIFSHNRAFIPDSTFIASWRIGFHPQGLR